MIEESIPTFEAYCKHQDASVVTTVSEKSSNYQELVKAYAEFASSGYHANTKTPVSKPNIIRWKTVGLRAIKAAVESEAFGVDAGKQLNVTLPVILENLYSDGGDIFFVLQQKAQQSETSDVQQARKRRMSNTTVATVDTVEANPLTAASTTADADRVDEDEVRILAVRCLKQIFSAGYGTNRGQIRLATLRTLQFIALRKPADLSDAGSRGSIRQGNWATSLIETVARWTPVQDRFIIVVTAVEQMVRSPIVEANLEHQLTLATLIDWLLSSTINMIGLSVMDVLLGFVQHVLLLLQLGGRDSKIYPHHQQTAGLDLFSETNETIGIGSAPATRDSTRLTETVTAKPSITRQKLLFRLQKCIGDLATHIYYTDQVSDMIISILARLKPSTNADVPSTAAAIENPSAAANAIANSVSLQEDPTTDAFFSFATARVTALKAIKDILVVANFKKSATGPVAEARSRVGLNVWEGTQWLLRDEAPEVRFAYVDALLTWMKLETNKNDLQLVREDSRRVKPDSKRGASTEAKLAKRAASNASRGERHRKANQSTFLQLLHLAIYEDALESPEDESNILLLHLLLVSTVERLGVNALRFGLPMIFKLQDDLRDDSLMNAPNAKIALGSLIYGYLGAVSEKFDFETSRVGTEIHGEISRRRRKDTWLNRIAFPPVPLDQITIGFARSEISEKPSNLISEPLKPFNNRADLVDEIAKAYDSSLVSPPQSPPSSPGRVFSVPSLGFGYGYGTTQNSKPAPEDQLPEKVKEQMLAEWTKESCVAEVEKDTAQTSSMTGSKKTTGSAPNTYLAVTGNNGQIANGHPSGNNSPTYPPDYQKQFVGGRGSPAFGLIGGLTSVQNFRRISTQEGSPGQMTPRSSSRDSTVRVNELKRVLSVNRNSVRHSSPLRNRRSKQRTSTSVVSDDDSDSLVSYSDAEGGDISTLGPNATAETAANHKAERSSTTEAPPKTPPQTESGISRADQAKTSSAPSSPSHKEYIRPGSRPKNEDIPPVPPIPSTLNLPGGFPSDGSPVRPSTAKSEAYRQSSPASQRRAASVIVTDHEGRTSRRKSRSVTRKDNTIELSSWVNRSSLFEHRADLGKLLAGIDSGTGGPPTTARQQRGGISTPPY